MEIFELRYFLGVARDQNIHQASERLNVSPSSLSKAISRLESELEVSLFLRAGRNIKLTEQGRIFQRRASEIVQLEESARMELSGVLGSIQIVIAGSEILLSEYGVEVTRVLKKHYPRCVFEYRTVTEEEAIRQVERGEAHLALTTSELPARSGLTTKLMGEAQFQTVAGAAHPILAQKKRQGAIPVDELLKFPFVSSDLPILGRIERHQSPDGWRDDQFPRRIEYQTLSLKLLESLVVSGQALAYLPDYFARQIDVHVLKVSGCPYSCTQRIQLVAKNPKVRTWMRPFFQS